MFFSKSRSSDTTGPAPEPAKDMVSEPSNDVPQRFLPGDRRPNGKKVLRKQLVSILIMLTINVGIPLGLYYGLRNVIGVLYALIVSGSPPFLYVIYGFMRKRTIDALGCIICLSYILSGVVSIISGNARIAVLRDSAVTAVVGAMFLITLVPVRTKWFTLRPLTYIMAHQWFSHVKYHWIDRDGNPQEESITEWQWREIRFFRISMYTQTAAWGILLVMEFVAVLLMVQSPLSIDDIVLYNNVITSTVVPVMVIVSIVFGILNKRHEVRIGKAWVAENDFSEQYAPRQASETTGTNAV